MQNNSSLTYQQYSQLKDYSLGKNIPDNFERKVGAGILIYSAETKEFLALERSLRVRNPGILSISGGMSKLYKNNLESPIITAVAESFEEMGYLPNGKLLTNPFAYANSRLTYYTFLLVINKKERLNFEPNLNWEHSGYCWIKTNEINYGNIHPGLEEVLSDIKKTSNKLLISYREFLKKE
ncbi:MAG: NUDIX hydrolase [Nanoarchaeota archaeon]